MAETSSGALLTPSPKARVARLAGQVALFCFQLWLFLSLTTPSWRYGAFGWWPLARFELVAGAPLSLGLFNLLPVLILSGWLVHRLLGHKKCPWRWGPSAFSLPFLGLTVLAVISSSFVWQRNTFLLFGFVLLSWLVYLYVLNQRPRLIWPLAAIVLIQSLVAMAQFVTQEDLGLIALGELPLDPAWEGISVLFAIGRPWLRAYGLTVHPNLLGAILSALLLILLPSWQGGRLSRRWQVLLSLLLIAGLLGLVLSFSRAAWLGFLSGLVVWLALDRRQGASRSWRRWLALALPVLLMLFFYRQLVLSRIVALDSPIEAFSINERLRDLGLALRLIVRTPWTGVGQGGYLAAARQLDPDAVLVHNVPLLVAAETGLLALGLWFLLIAAPFFGFWRRRFPPAAQLAPWVSMIVIGFFDTTLWWTSNWQTSILFALLAAHLNWNLTGIAAQPTTMTK